VSLALVIQHATRMRYIVLPYVAFLDLQHVSSLSHKRYDSRKKVIEHEIRVLIFSTMFSEIYLILRRIQRDIITSLQSSSVQVPAIVSKF